MWTKFQHIDDNDPEGVKEQKRFNNSILLDRYPYFFIYRYTKCRREYKNYRERVEITCKQKFGCSLDELEHSDKRTEEQEVLLRNYYRYMPVIISDSPMNLICRRIEKTAREITDKSKLDEFDYTILKYKGVEYDKEKQKRVLSEIKKYLQVRKEAAVATSYMEQCSTDIADPVKFDDYTEDMLLKVLPDIRETVNILIDFFYRDNPGKSRDLLWSVFGKYIINNIKRETVYLPMPDDNGKIEYLGKKYSIVELKTE